MKLSLSFIRNFLFALTFLFTTTYILATAEEINLWKVVTGVGIGACVAGVLIASGYFFKRLSLSSFNLIIVGLFFGYLMSLALVTIFNAILTFTGTSLLHKEVVDICKIFLFLLGPYVGVIVTFAAASELYFSIPFVKFSPLLPVAKEILLDASVLQDHRLLDLAASGLIDKRVTLPRFLLKELYEQEETSDESALLRARRSLEIVKKLETLQELNLKYSDTDFPDIKDQTGKVMRLAKLLDAYILTLDPQRTHPLIVEGVRLINLHTLANSLKPMMQRGEHLKIKIQRLGKEENQGVGYLEDGTMVVVNGGGESLGFAIKAKVLSVKQTSSGRMIFCNLAEETSELSHECH